MVTNKYGTGMLTTRDMWEIVRDLLDGEKLPESINQALYALCEGDAMVQRKANPKLNADVWKKVWDDADWPPRTGRSG